MKKVLFVAGALMFGLTSYGQGIFSLMENVVPASQKAHFENVKLLLNRQNARGLAQKPTGIQQRVIAQTLNGYGDNDSTAFYYSGTRGSRFNYNNPELAYRQSYYGFYQPENELLSPASDMQADSITYYYNGAIEKKYAAHFRPDNQMDAVYNYFSVGQYDKYIRVFDNQNLLTRIYGTNGSPGSGGIDTSMIQGIYYNNNFSLVTSDTMWSSNGSGGFEHFQSNEYSYDGNGLLTEVKTYYGFGAPTGVVSYQVKIAYDANQQLSSIRTYIFDGQALSLAFQDSFAYTPGVDYFTTWTANYWENGSFESGVKMVQYPGANGLPDSIEAFEQEDEGLPYDKVGTAYYSYNSFNNPEMIVVLDENFTDTISRQRFYYETFDDENETGIERLAKDVESLQVYPNPFSRKINIDWKLPTLQQARVKLFDNMGRLVFLQEMNLTTGHNDLFIPELQEGAYFLLLEDPAGKRWGKKLIRK